MFFIVNRAEKNAYFLQPDVVTGIEEVTSTTGSVVKAIRKFPKRIMKLVERIPHQEVIFLELHINSYIYSNCLKFNNIQSVLIDCMEFN